MGGTLAFWNFVMDKYAETGLRLADAMDVGPYKDRFFRTLMSLYEIDSDGKIFTNDETGGAKIALIGGIRAGNVLGGIPHARLALQAT